jgi:hypothetical protein
MKKNVKIILLILGIITAILCVILIPYSTVSVDTSQTFGTNFELIPKDVSEYLTSNPSAGISDIQDFLTKSKKYTDSGIKLILYALCLNGKISECGNYTVSDSTTDTFDLVYGQFKESELELNVKKLIQKIDSNDNSVKTNLLHTIFLI